jgi:hypothetical protein
MFHFNNHGNQIDQNLEQNGQGSQVGHFEKP